MGYIGEPSFLQWVVRFLWAFSRAEFGVQESAGLFYVRADRSALIEEGAKRDFGAVRLGLFAAVRGGGILI